MESSVYIKRFKVAIGILIIALILFLLLLARTIPNFQNIFALQKEYNQQNKVLNDAIRRLKNIKDNIKLEQKADSQVIKAFYRPIGSGMDTEAAISDEFGEILQIMRDNKIKARSIKYDYDPQDDNFVKYAASRYHVCRITADMIANYSDFENFLRDLYKHEHFLEIASIEIVPYEKDKKIILVTLQLKLYAQKSSNEMESSAPEVEAIMNN